MSEGTAVKASHTPRPWVGGLQISGPGGRSIAHVQTREKGLHGYTNRSAPWLVGEAEANAALIRAAPDLLEALYSARDELSRLAQPGTIASSDVRMEVEAAIGKVEDR